MIASFDWIVLGFAAVALGVPVVVAWTTGWRRGLALAVVIDAVALCWMFLPLTWSGWLIVYILLALFSLCAWMGARLSPTLTLMFGIAWLSMPLWTSVGGNWIDVHPLLTANAISGFGPWLEQPLPYELTALGTEVPYALSDRWVTTALMHGVLGLILGACGFAERRVSRSRRPEPTPHR
ncbi:MAG: hypothetical protein AAGD32_05060 [Planctomycetota bacterium]